MNIVERYKPYQDCKTLLTASSSQPPNPVHGQIWIDTSSNQLMAYVDDKWARVVTNDKGYLLPENRRWSI
jgi:hypothetical protein